MLNDKEAIIYTAKDFESDQEIRWCPGCGDFAILKQVQNVLPELQIPKEKIVFVSGIGCSSRFPYYLNTYGFHTIHGRATAIATGLKLSRPDLSVWVVTGDGDALSIGGNHLIHTFRRNPDINILLFNNQIYGLTKGQYSPTSELNKVTKSSPFGSADMPFNPISLALGANAGFIARSMDREAKHLQEMLRRSNSHAGTSFLEIYQNCHIFNDGAFEIFSNRTLRKDYVIFLEHGKPLTFSENKGIRLEGYIPQVVDIGDNYSVDDLWIHDEQDVFKAQILARFFEEPISEIIMPRPFGVIFNKQLPVLNDLINGNSVEVNSNVNGLISGEETWIV